MNRLFFTSILILTFFSGYAQKIKFSDTSNKWSYATSGFNGDAEYFYEHEFIFYRGDTNINGTHYQQLWQLGDGYRIINSTGNHAFEFNDRLQVFAYTREDTSTGIVQFLLPWDTTTEHLLFNFNAQVGDSFRHVFTWCYSKVARVDSVQIGNVFYKTWEYNSYDSGSAPDYTYHIIEGMGSVNEMDEFIYCRSGVLNYAAKWDLLCFKNNKSIPSITTYYFNNSGCFLSVNAVEKQFLCTVIPNPADNSAYIQMPYRVDNGFVVITDIIGHTVVNSKLNTDKFYLNTYLNIPGLYFYKIFDQNHQTVHSGRFIYQ